MGQVLPLAPGTQHVEDAVEDFPFVGVWSSQPGRLRQQGANGFPLGIREIRAIGSPLDMPIANRLCFRYPFLGHASILHGSGGFEITSASANDEGRSHPDKSQTIPHLPPGYEVTFKFTVDTQFQEGTTVTIELSSEEDISASDSRTDCRQLDRGDLSVIDLAILQGVRTIAK